MVKAIFAGSFDPISNGHLDIVNRSMSICDQLIIAIGINPAKKTLFSEETRVKQINAAINSNVEFVKSYKIEVASFQGLLADYAKKVNASVLIRGVRSVSDFEYEMNLALINRFSNPNIETFFIPANSNLAAVSSSMVKEIARNGGDVSKFVPANIVKELHSIFSND